MIQYKKVIAVVVTYHPALEGLRVLLKAVIGQVDQVIIVDNGSDTDFETLDIVRDNVEHISIFLQSENTGVADAQNKGIAEAMQKNATHVLLLDQDSIPPQNMVTRYLAVMEQLLAANKPVAAIGPRYRDSQTGQASSFVIFKWFRYVKKSASDDSPIVPTDILISSGSFYEVDIFKKIGFFNNDLFIDHVDTEWFHRAAYRGFKCFGVWDVVMEHSLGERNVRPRLLRRHNLQLHKPFRLYYITRNSLLLYKMPHVPLKWVSGDVLRLMYRILMHVFFSKQRVDAIGWILRGLTDGFCNVTGPAPKSRFFLF